MPDHTAVWSTEVRKGLLELCVLSVLGQEPSYGYRLAQSLQEYGELSGGIGTIYPLLTRLERQGLVETYWRESSSGPPRKYYQLSEAGQRTLSELITEWITFRTAVDRLLNLSDQSAVKT